MRIVVAGGTGVVGAHVVSIARQQGHMVRVLSRSEGVDLMSAAAIGLDDVDVLIDVTSIQTTRAQESRTFFTTVTGRLLAAGLLAGVKHYVLLSIVGIDRAPYGYYAGKIEQEQLVSRGGLPWTILRSTQFHEFAEQIHSRLGLGSVSLVPAMQSQPIAAREVAERLVDLAEAGPSGRVTDLAGPRVERMAEMTRQWAKATHNRGLIIEVPIVGRLGRAMRDGTLLGSPQATLGRQTFTQWLDG